MADTVDMAPASNASPAGARNRSRSRRRDEDLEAQITRLQEDLKSITSTISHIAERKVGEAQASRSRRPQPVRGGQQAVEEIQDEFGRSNAS